MSFSYITFNAAGLIVCRDPERHDFQNGKSVLSFSVCDNRSVKNDSGGYTDKPHYFDVKYWCKDSQKADWWLARITKGARLAISGRLDQERWEKDGQKHSKIVLTAMQIIPPFIDKQAAPMGNDPQNPAEYFGGTEASDEVPF